MADYTIEDLKQRKLHQEWKEQVVEWADSKKLLEVATSPERLLEKQRINLLLEDLKTFLDQMEV